MNDADDWVALLESDGQPVLPVGATPAGEQATVASRGPAVQMGAWWRAAERSTRLLALLAGLAALTASALAVAAGTVRHPVAHVVRTVPAPAPALADALGCPVHSTCAVRSATAASLVLRYIPVKTPPAPSDPFTAHFAELPLVEASGTEVRDANDPRTIYARRLRATGSYDGASIVVQVDAQCLPGRPAGRPRTQASAALGAPVAVDTLLRTYGTCSIRVSCSYQGLFTAGGYPFDSPEIAAFVAAVAGSPRIRL